MRELFSVTELGDTADWWALVLTHSLWLATILALAVGVALAMINHRRTSLRSGIALAGLMLSLIGSIAITPSALLSSPTRAGTPTVCRLVRSC